MARESGARRRRRRAEDVREGDQNLEAVYVTTTAGCCHLFSSSPTPVESSFIIQKVNFEWVEGELFTEEIGKMLNFFYSKSRAESTATAIATAARP